MEKKQMLFKTRGMNRDLSVSAFNPEFAFENLNLRLKTNEGNSMLSWVTEKGTLPIKLAINTTPWVADVWPGNYTYTSIVGTVIGTAVINNYLVLFTTNSEEEGVIDRIYRFENIGTDNGQDVLKGKLLFKGSLGFDVNHPLETLVDYEASHIQKVYWVDGNKQPRFINVAATNETLAVWNNPSNSLRNTLFDFVPSMVMEEEVTITKDTSSGGLFAPGVIQYMFTYIKKNGQQSNIVYSSPLYYISHADRGEAPDRSVACSFTISIAKADYSYDYIRLYSLQRTSLNAVPVVKILDDIPILRSGYTREEVYESSLVAGYIYPTRDVEGNIKQISNVTISNGSYEIIFEQATEISTPAPSWHVDDDPQFIIYDDNNQIIADIIGFSTLLTYSIYHETALSEALTLYNYHAELKGTQIAEFIESLVPDEYSSYGIGLVTTNGGTIESLLPISDLRGRTLVYDYNSSTWYLQKYSNPPAPVQEYIHYAEECVYVDNGTSGSTLDPTELLYVGGHEITALTMAEKSKTLFLGNISQVNNSIEAIQDYFDDNRDSEHPIVSFHINGESGAEDVGKSLTLATPSGVYSYENELKDNQRKITTFKGGETYRFGFQLQKATGEWSEPIFIDDASNTKYPKTSVAGTTVDLVYAEASIDLASISGLDYSIYKRIRPVIVYPNIGERQVLCQGVINPTVFNSMDRMENAPYAQASWFFRPYVFYLNKNRYTDDNPELGPVEFTHYQKLFSTDAAKSFGEGVEPSPSDAINSVINRVEIQGSVDSHEKWKTGLIESSSRTVDSNTEFFVDQNIITLNSPDLEFDTEAQSLDKSNFKLRIVGAIPITSNVSSHDITIGTSMLTTFPTYKYGTGELNKDDSIVYNSPYPVYPGNRLIAQHLWEDSYWYINNQQDVLAPYLAKHVVYPWHRSSSLNNDYRNTEERASLLKTKVESTLLFSTNSCYISALSDMPYYENTDIETALTENSQVMNYRMFQDGNPRNYYANIDKVLYNNTKEGLSIGYDPGYFAEIEDGTGSYLSSSTYVANSILMKYKSTTHVVIALDKKEFIESNTSVFKYPIMPKGRYNENYSVGGMPQSSDYSGTSFWQENMHFYQDEINVGNLFGSTKYSFLWLGELYTEVPSPFGGKSKNAVRNNNWLIAGDTQELVNGEANLYWTDGDTYYQRYDCLKTYPFTNEDPNQLVEICSFMCETRINIDGRYDKNRGLDDNVNIRPENFNLLNSVYSQRNNFFPIKKSNTDSKDTETYPNYILYSKTKESGADVDLWTNVNMGSVVEMEGHLGEVNSIRKLNDNLLVLQDEGVSQLLYDERTQITTTEGVPVEIANSGKVQGARYLSNSIGCSNKWSVVNTPSGVYFIDSKDKNVYMIDSGLAISNVSLKGGMSTWFNQQVPDIKNEKGIFLSSTNNDFVSYYDRSNQDVFFISKDKAVAWNETLGAFTSFYNYENAPFFCNLGNLGVWIKQVGENTLWSHQKGAYCKFFGTNCDYGMTLIGNPEPTEDKIFTNLEFSACVHGEGAEVSSVYTPYKPFDYLEVWDEYQHGMTNLDILRGHASMQHFVGDTSSLKRKFRLWRCDIPRDNASPELPTPPVDPTPEQQAEYNAQVAAIEAAYRAEENSRGIFRYSRKPNDRMRNPWVYLKLLKKANNSIDARKAEIHNLLMTYFK